MNESKLIDGAFYVEEQRWKTWKSFDENGKELITSLNEHDCIRATRWYLKMRQEDSHK